MTTPHSQMDPRDDFMSGGTKSCSFKGNPGITWAGEILEIRKEQARDFDTGQPKVWQDNNPVMQYVFKIQTDQRDPADPEDDGVRALYLATPRQQRAVQDAVRASGAKRPEVGGRVSLTYTHDDVAAQKNPRYSPPKAYKAVYEAPSGFPAADPTDPWSQATPQAPATPTPPTPGYGTPVAAATAPVTAANPAGPVSPDLVAFLASHNIPAAGMTQGQAELIAKSFR